MCKSIAFAKSPGIVTATEPPALRSFLVRAICYFRGHVGRHLRLASRCPFMWDMNPHWCSLRWLFGSSSPRRPVPSASPYFLAPPESVDSTWHDEDYRIEHIGPEAE